MRMKSVLMFLFLVAVLAAAGQPARGEVTVEEVKAAVLKELGARPKTSDASVFNPAMGAVLDVVASDTTLNKANFEMRSLELNIQGTVDPFGKMYAVINGNADGFEVEEAAVITNPFLCRINLRLGRYFANFGRLPKFHDHELPFVYRTPSLENFIDGESQATGAEFTHLFGTPFFLQGTFGVTNKIGSENTRLEANTSAAQPDPNAGDAPGRSWNAMTYNARLVTYVPFGDNHGVDLGFSEAYTPRENYIDGIYVSNSNDPAFDFSNNRRYLTGADFTYRYEPLEKNVFRKFIWGTEIFNNQERRGVDMDADGTPQEFVRVQAWGGYTYAEGRFWAKTSVGGFYDYDEDLSDSQNLTQTAGVYSDYFLSEFQRIRLQYSEQWSNQPDVQTDHQVYLQWTAAIGNHTHTFRDR